MRRRQRIMKWTTDNRTYKVALKFDGDPYDDWDFWSRWPTERNWKTYRRTQWRQLKS